MKTQKSKRIPLNLILIVSAIIIVIGSVSVFAFMNSRQSPTDQTKQTDSSTKTSDDKKAFIENTDKNGQPINNESPDNPNVSITLSEDANQVIVQTQLTDISTGECTLTIGSFSVSAPVLYQPEFSTCEGFSVQKSEIDTSLTFKLVVVSEGKTFTTEKELGD